MKNSVDEPKACELILSGLSLAGIELRDNSFLKVNTHFLLGEIHRYMNYRYMRIDLLALDEPALTEEEAENAARLFAYEDNEDSKPGYWTMIESIAQKIVKERGE